MARTRDRTRTRARTSDRTLRALQLRAAGLTYEAIGGKLGITRQSAHELVTRALEAQQHEIAEDAKQVLELELVRIDGIIEKLWPRRGDPRAADAILHAMQRRARLLGLDAPDRRELSGPNGLPLGAPMGLEVVFVHADGTRRPSLPPRPQD